MRDGFIGCQRYPERQPPLLDHRTSVHNSNAELYDYDFEIEQSSLIAPSLLLTSHVGFAILLLWLVTM